MRIKELTIKEFDDFSKSHPLTSFRQTSKYALFMAENGYDYDLLGLVDNYNNIIAAALILIRKINISLKYGYSPAGFLLEYFNYDILKIFTEKIKDYYNKKLIFIKINPPISIGEINSTTKEITYNKNLIIRDYLQELGYTKLKDNMYFESLIPRFSAILDIENYNINNIAKNTRNKIIRANNKGLVLLKSDRQGLDILYEFIKKKKNIDAFYYKNYYNIFSKDSSCDLFLVKIDYNKYLNNSKKLYDKELEKNNKLAEEIIINAEETNINKKMESDKNLLAYKNDIEIATIGLRENKESFLAGAFVIKYQDTANIIISGYNPSYRKFNANYFLHEELINYYKNNYKYLDLNGITGDFSTTNPYKGLNDFKLGYKPKLFELIGEFDLLINPKVYKKLAKNGTLAKIFNNKNRKTSQNN